MTIITLSRQFGSGGDLIAQRVGEILGFPHFDKRLIIQAAQDSGLSEQEIVDYTEDNHRVKTFFDRLFDRDVVTATGRVWREDSSGARVADEVRLSEEVIVTLVQKAIRGAVRTGNMIIIGRGGQVILKDEPDTFHIRVEAPLEDRIHRVKELIRHEHGIGNTDIELRRRAQDRIIERDAASADYLRRFYHVDWADPMLYHLVINTGKVSIEQASALIVAAVREFSLAAER